MLGEKFYTASIKSIVYISHRVFWTPLYIMMPPNLKMNPPWPNLNVETPLNARSQFIIFSNNFYTFL